MIKNAAVLQCGRFIPGVQKLLHQVEQAKWQRFKNLWIIDIDYDHVRIEDKYSVKYWAKQISEIPELRLIVKWNLVEKWEGE